MSFIGHQILVLQLLWGPNRLPRKQCNFPRQDDYSWWHKHPYQQGATSRYCSLSGNIGCSWPERPFDFATHHFGNSLDIVITSQDDPMVNTVVQGELFSDHHLVFFNITSSIIMYQVEEISYRKTKLISPDTFAGDISCELEFANVYHLNLKSGLALYNSTLTQVLNQHAPMKRNSVPNWKQVPWFMESIRDEIRKHRQLEWSGGRTRQTQINIMISALNIG